jgi:hypothetical protein
MNNPNQ